LVNGCDAAKGSSSNKEKKMARKARKMKKVKRSWNPFRR